VTLVHSVRELHPFALQVNLLLLQRVDLMVEIGCLLDVARVEPVDECDVLVLHLLHSLVEIEHFLMPLFVDPAHRGAERLGLLRYELEKIPLLLAQRMDHLRGACASFDFRWRYGLRKRNFLRAGERMGCQTVKFLLGLGNRNPNGLLIRSVLDVSDDLAAVEALDEIAVLQSALEIDPSLLQNSLHIRVIEKCGAGVLRRLRIGRTVFRGIMIHRMCKTNF
jgi:hypothetical protein